MGFLPTHPGQNSCQKYASPRIVQREAFLAQSQLIVEDLGYVRDRTTATVISGVASLWRIQVAVIPRHGQAGTSAGLFVQIHARRAG